MDRLGNVLEMRRKEDFALDNLISRPQNETVDLEGDCDERRTPSTDAVTGRSEFIT